MGGEGQGQLADPCYPLARLRNLCCLLPLLPVPDTPPPPPWHPGLPMPQAARQAEATALRRLGAPHEQAAAIAFLVSGDAAYVTGETLVVSGGMHSRL